MDEQTTKNNPWLVFDDDALARFGTADDLTNPFTDDELDMIREEMGRRGL